MDKQNTGNDLIIVSSTSKHYYFNHYSISINSDNDCFFAGDARNSKGTVTMTVLQHFMEEEAELKKQIEATKLQGEELKAREKNIDPKLVRVMNGDFEGIGLEELKKFHDMLVEIKSMIDDQLN
jgi:hypothetical protein